MREGLAARGNGEALDYDHTAIHAGTCAHPFHNSLRHRSLSVSGGMVTVHEARATARRWVAEEAAADVDVMVLTTHQEPPPRLGKFVRDGVIRRAPRHC